MATQTPSTEPLRAQATEDPSSSPTAVHIAQPAATLQIPGQAPAVVVDGPPDDDERRPRTADRNNASQNNSRAPSPRPPSALYPHTQVVFQDADFTRPPPLNYSLYPRKKALFIFWTLILLDCVAMPIALYFGLWYGTGLSPNAVFSISTGALGTVSIVEYFIRFHRLWKKNSSCRVIGAKRFYLDWFHWNLSVGWFFVMIELIVGTVFTHPPIRLLALPASTMIFAIGCELLIIDILRLAGVPAPVRVSSLPRGAALRPGIYAYIEDVCAVDGSGGTEFRQRLNLRYQASKHFREMLHRLTLFWAIGAIGAAAVTTAIVFTIQRDAAYVVGWTVPFIWAGIWTAMTIPWVKRSLKKEYADWEHAKWKA